MLAFACNRRCNGLQLQNAVKFLACGVSSRVHEYLYSIGVVSSRYTAVQAVDRLARKAETNIRNTLSKNYKIRPFLCVDNLDFETRVHHKRLEEATRQFHGSWGYCHVVDKETLPLLPQDDGASHSSKDEESQSDIGTSSDSVMSDLVMNNSIDNHADEEGVGVAEEKGPSGSIYDRPGLDNFAETMHKTLDEPVELSDFLPTKAEQENWKQTVISQMNRACLELVIPSSNSMGRKMPQLMLHPPSIEQINVEDHSIIMLKLMDSPENSAEGIGQLITRIQKQMGIYNTDQAHDLQVVEGDLGTCINIEGLRRKRLPKVHLDESIENILTIPGAAHTLWNIGQSVLLHHWGNPLDSDDSGTWRFWESLGGKGNRPVKKKDFSSIMTIIRQVHMASLAFCLKQTVSRQKADFDIYDGDQISEVVQECFHEYFTAPSLNRKEQEHDWHGYNLCLRLRDFASIVEGEDAMRQGDIGRVISMWRRWSLMAQGMKGLSHYALHLPRLILLLEIGLPRDLAQLIKHSMLIPASGRAGHFIAKDFYLELQNYWLKYFYNHSVGFLMPFHSFSF